MLFKSPQGRLSFRRAQLQSLRRERGAPHFESNRWEPYTSQLSINLFVLCLVAMLRCNDLLGKSGPGG